MKGAPVWDAFRRVFGHDRGMFRRAFVLSVNPGCEAEYERRHSPIWSDLEETLRRHGVHAYSIFLEPESRQLFGYVEFSSPEQWDAIAGTDACRRWWRHMRDLMPTHADDRPVSRDLREVFRLGPETDPTPNGARGISSATSDSPPPGP